MHNNLFWFHVTLNIVLFSVYNIFCLILYLHNVNWIRNAALLTLEVVSQFIHLLCDGATVDWCTFRHMIDMCHSWKF